MAGRVLDQGPGIGDLGQHPIAALSAAVLRAARQAYRENWTDLAAQAGVAPEVVNGAEDGTRPAWALSYFEFTALADAVSALAQSLRSMFELAVACDLILSCVLDGDQSFATDVLVEPGSRHLARSLLGLAITGEMVGGSAATAYARLPGGRAFLDASQVALLRERAVALASSGSPDAWVGAEIAAICRGEQR